MDMQCPCCIYATVGMKGLNKFNGRCQVQIALVPNRKYLTRAWKEMQWKECEKIRRREKEEKCVVGNCCC